MTKSLIFINYSLVVQKGEEIRIGRKYQNGDYRQTGPKMTGRARRELRKLEKDKRKENGWKRK